MSKRNFLPEDELRYRQISNARFSPDGKKVVYALKQNDIEHETISSHLWLFDLESSQNRQLTFGEQSNSSPEWSPDGKKIAFKSSRTEKLQIFLLPCDGGEAVQFTHLKQGVGEGPVWSPDGSRIAFTAGPEGEPADLTKPYRITRFIYRYDGIGYLDPAVKNIYVQTLDGGEAVRLTDHGFLARSLQWSPDSHRILYMADHDPDRSDLFSAAVHTIDLDGRDAEILGLDWGWMTEAAWSADGKKIIVSGIEKSKPMGAKADLWLVDPAGGETCCLTADLKTGSGYGFGKYLVADENHVLGCAPHSGMGEIYEIPLKGGTDCKPVVTGCRSALLQDVQGSRILFLHDTMENPTELAVFDRQTGQEKILTDFNSSWLQEIDLPKVENLHFTNAEGIPIEGWIMLPAQGKPPYPTILNIHGGPHGGFGYDFRSDFMMLTGAGYAVLFINPRGSMGYGDEFSTALSGHWGVMDYPELMAGVDYVIQKGLADPDHLGVCGLSYGGYMTCFTVGQTSRFKAAVAENPITDLVSRYGTADMGAWGSLGELGGKPHEIPEVYRRSSPVTYAHLCKTPTLLIQGESDYRCPAGQSEQFYTVLKANGCITEMLRLPNMPHVGSISGPIPVQKAQNEALLEWMNRFVLKQ